MYHNAGIAEWQQVGKQGRDNSTIAVQHNNPLRTSFSIIHEKSYVGVVYRTTIPTYISNAFLLIVYIIIWKIVNKQPSHLSGVEQWRQSPHDVEGAERKFYSYYHHYNTMINSPQFTELK